MTYFVAGNASSLLDILLAFCISFAMGVSFLIVGISFVGGRAIRFFEKSRFLHCSTLSSDGKFGYL